MRRETWNDLAVLAAVAEAGSFAGAGRALGVSPSAVSHALRGLEDRLGTRLLNRSTRSVAPTQAGERLLAALRPAVASVEEAVSTLEQRRGRPAGRIRVTAHRSAALFTVLPRLPAFTRAYPEVEVELWIEEGLVDIVAAGFDAGIRMANVLQPDMISVRIDDGVDDVYVASPAYPAEAGTPRVPLDLLEHRCINYRLASSRALVRWPFERAGEEVLVDVPGQLVFNDMEAGLRAALAGCRIAMTIKEQARPYLASGELVALLVDWTRAEKPNFLYYAGRRNVPPALRAFIDAMRTRS
jgi:DNA-binding transcriptional LysR family regulator